MRLWTQRVDVHFLRVISTSIWFWSSSSDVATPTPTARWADDPRLLCRCLFLTAPDCMPAAQVGCGLKAFQVRIHPEFDTSRCFFVLRTDGTEEDFSYRKCLETLLPNDSAPPLPSKARKARTQKVAGVDARRTPPKGKLGSRGRAARGRGKDAGANRAGIAKPGRGAGGRGARGGAVRGRGRGRAGLGLRK